MSETIEQRYELEELAGRGAFSEVFRARDRSTGALVALKRLRGDGDDPHARDRLAREGRLLRRVRSPHVVRALGDGVDAAGRACLVLEWLEGEDLACALRRGPLAPGRALDRVREAARGLEELHLLGVVHRDVKPGNVFLAREGVEGRERAVLLDLGIARVAGDAGLTTAGLRMGTPAYMAPEQARGDEPLTPRVDVYALAVVLFELLAGRRPFGGGDAFTVVARVLMEPTPRLRSVLAGAPAELDALLARAMAKDPHARVGSMAAFREALEALAPACVEPLARAMAGLGALEGTPRGDDDEWETEAHTRPMVPLGAGDEGTVEPAQRGAAALLGVGLGALGLRVATVLLAGWEGSAGAARGSVARAEALARAHGAQRVERVLRAGGYGSALAVVFGAERVSGDEALRACALALELTAGSAAAASRVSVATGHWYAGAESVGREGEGAGGALLERAVAGLARASEGPWLDAATASAARGRYRLREELGGDGAVLRGALEAGEGPRDNERGAASEALVRGVRTETVGRERELARLAARFDACVENAEAHAVLVVAPAGQGKSRLRRELVARVRARAPDGLVLLGAADPLGAGGALGPLGRAVRGAARARGIALARGPRSEGAEVPAWEQLAGAGLARAERARVGAVLAELCGAPWDDARCPPWLLAARREPSLMADALRDGWTRWLEAQCDAGPVLLVLEDLHWGAEGTVRLVSAALRALRERPLLVLALGRPEVRERFGALWSEHGLEELALGPLPPSAARALAVRVWGEAAGDDALAAVVDRAQGSPFVLEELLRAGPGAPAPASVLGLVQARLDRVDDGVAAALRAASVFGARVPPEAVAAVLARGLDEVSAALRRACDAELLAPLGAPSAEGAGRGPLRFAHALVREAVYASWLPEERAAAHAAAARWLEQSGARDPWTLAEHYERGGAPALAAAQLALAAEAALGADDYGGALDAARAGLALLVGDDTLARDTAGALHLAAADALAWRGAFREASGHAGRALGALARGGARWFRALGRCAALAGLLGAHGAVAAHAAEALATRARTDDPTARSAQASALCRAAEHLLEAGRAPVGDELLARAQALLAEVDRASALPEHDAAWSLSAARWALTAALYARARGDRDGALALLERAVEGFDRAGDVRHACRARADLAAEQCALGRYEQAGATLRVLLAAVERAGLHAVRGFARVVQARLARAEGRLDEAAARALEARAAGRSAEAPALEVLGALELARARVAAGLCDEAWALAWEAAERAAALPALRAQALLVAAQARVGAGDAAGAAAALRELDALGRVVALDELGVGVEATRALVAALAAKAASAR